MWETVGRSGILYGAENPNLRKSRKIPVISKTKIKEKYTYELNVHRCISLTHKTKNESVGRNLTIISFTY